MLKVGSCAAKTYKLRQDREEAAVSNFLRVPQGNLAGANCSGGACYYRSKSGARSEIPLPSLDQLEVEEL